MDSNEVAQALRTVKQARDGWNEARRQFDHEVERTLKRLMHEAIANRMSVADVVRYSGLTRQQVHTRLKRYGLQPSQGKTLLAKTAADALRKNADLLGVDTTEIDLLSPLAYLEGGKNLLRQTRPVRSAEVDEA